MQKFFLIIICIFMTSNAAYSMTTKEYTDALELKLFGATFQNQSLGERVDRIEMQIYDNCYSGSPEERLEKIDKIYPKSEFETGKIEPVNPEYSQNCQPDDIEVQNPADYNNYPIVSKIEENIYKKNYSNEDIYKRLARLETELYGNVKEDESLESRVERLKSVLPQKKQNNFSAQKPNSKPQINYSQNNEFNALDILSELEIETFNKIYTNDSPNKRIERLEDYYYGGVSMGQNESDRLLKLAAIVMSSRGMKDYFPAQSRGTQWAEILMKVLVVGLGFLM